MLVRVRPLEFVRPISNGRTQPLLLSCEKADGSAIEVIAKFSGYCEQKTLHLAREVIAACLAGDLGLPVPEPVLIEVSDDWIAIIPDAQRRAKLQESSRIAFGSCWAGSQFTAWNAGTTLLAATAQTAAEVFTFDAIVQNTDRRAGNPNCLVRGTDIRIFDHELAFAHGVMLFWHPPWRPGSLNLLETPGNHIFRDGLRRHTIDWARIRQAWAALSDDMIDEYVRALPAEWEISAADIDRAVSLIRGARDNIDACLTEVKRVLG